jgi:hypothetical protein
MIFNNRNMSFCSPGANNKVFCYSLNSLKKIALAWNYLNPTNTIDINNSINDLYLLIKKKLDKYLISSKNNYWAWLDVIKILNNNKNPKITRVMKEIEINELRPSQPVEWINNKTEWLSNFDIEKVLIQYHNDPSFKYHFHGVFTIDFGQKSSNGTCKYYDNCNISMKDIIKSGKLYFGFVTNLCKYDEPGTHWTSSFFILDPSLNSYGAYYYDSVKRPIPKLLKPVFIDIQKQMNSIYPHKKFNIHTSNIAHQHSNTECGVFSIAFQTRWLSLLTIDAKKASFKTVIEFNKMNDDVMKLLRFRFFRPNSNTILKK